MKSKRVFQLIFLSILFIFICGCAFSSSQGRIENFSITIDRVKKILDQNYPGYLADEKYQSIKKYTKKCDYQIYLPKKYESSNKYPLLLSFSIGVDHWKKYADKYDFIFVHADCGGYTVLALREKIIQNYSVNKNKIYLTGFSAGAYRSATIIIDQPQSFAGAILASGGSKPYRDDVDYAKQANKRFFITLGEDDFKENIQSGRELKKTLEKNGAKVIFELQPGYGHQYPYHKNEEMIKFVLNK